LDKLGPWGGKDVSDDDEEGYQMSDQDDIEEEVEDDASVASLSELLWDQDSDPVGIPTPKAATKQTPSNEKARKQKQPSTPPTNTATASKGLPNGKQSSLHLKFNNCLEIFRHLIQFIPTSRLLAVIVNETKVTRMK
jgi:hypothetical protein